MSVFGRCIGAAGVQGHYGQKYWQYRIPGRNPDFTGMTFVSKTQTWLARKGNIKSGWRFWEHFFPSWARIDFSSGHTLNSMGLPGKGIGVALKTSHWQKRTEPFFISIMAVEDTLQKRLDELQWITNAIVENVAFVGFKAFPIGIQVNRSCPNTGHKINVSEIVKESEKGLEIVHGALGWPTVEKYAIDTAPVEAIKELEHNPYCNGICVSNTVKYDYLGLGKKLFGKDISPLAHLGGGGISGPDLCPLVCDYIKKVRDAGFEKNINGGGGIFSTADVFEYRDAGADSVFVGSVATHHPKRVQDIIRCANTMTWRNR